MSIAFVFESYLFWALSLVALVLSAWAFIDALRHGSDSYQRADKRTKGFWLALTGGSALVCVFSFAVGGGGGFLQLIAACIASVYLADVRPAVSGGGRGYRF